MPAGKAAERFIRKCQTNYLENLSENVDLLRERLAAPSMLPGADQGADARRSQAQTLGAQSVHGETSTAVTTAHELQCGDLSAGADSSSETLSLTSARLADKSRASSESGSTRFSDPQGHVWQANSDAVMCTHCQITFNLVCRRHHCRLCGFVSSSIPPSPQVLLRPFLSSSVSPLRTDKRTLNALRYSAMRVRRSESCTSRLQHTLGFETSHAPATSALMR